MKIIFFDGHCNLCNWFVDFLIRRDRTQSLRFAPLQGKTAERELPPAIRESLATVVYLDNGKAYTESGAAIRAVSDLGGVFRLMNTLLVIPRFIRDAVYRYIARNRYKWFGRRETCRIPTESERARFLD